MGKFRNFGNEQQRLNIEFKELYIEIKNFLITKGFDTSSEELINYLKKEFYIAIGNGFHQHEIVFSGDKISLVKKKKKSASFQYLDEPNDWNIIKNWKDIKSFKKELLEKVKI